MKLCWTKTLALALLGSCAAVETHNEAAIEERQIFRPLQTYYSSNAKNPPVKVSKSGEELDPGYIFYAPVASKVYPMIMTNDGDLVWTGTSNVYAGINLRVQQLNGQDVLTFYRGYLDSYRGFTFGSTVILDQSYNIINEVCPKLGLYVPYSANQPLCEGDLHENEISPDGTLLITAFNTTRGDLSGVPGGTANDTNAWVVEAQFYELAMDGTILFEWHSLDHVPISSTKIRVENGAGQNATTPFDYFHINSVQKIGNQYLIDGRDVWACYLINPDGSIEWSFNGYNGGSFGPLPNAPTGIKGRLFSYQHDPRMANITNDSAVLTLFNNDDNEGIGHNLVPSTGFSFRLNFADMTCKLIRDLYDPPNPVNSSAEGSYQTLPNNNVFLGYGVIPTFKEFGPDSNTDVRMTFTFGPGPLVGSYRAYKSEWVGMPTTNPSVAVQAAMGKGYVSWNGATEVTRYTISVGSRKKLKRYASVAKTGFETSFNLPAATAKGKYIRVAAYSGTQLLGKSAVTKYKS